MALAGAVGADDEHGGALGEVSAGGEIVNEGAVDVERAIEVELFQGLGGAKRCASQAQGKLLLLASGDLVLDEKGKELGVGEFGLDRLAIARFQRIENAMSGISGQI